MKLRVVCDLREERWFSMDLLADMLIAEAGRLPGVQVERVRPELPALLERAASPRGAAPFERWGYRAGIGIGRYVQYPLHLLGRRAPNGWYHVADHSYAHLLFELPRRRTGVFCHDIDAFRPLLEASSLPRRALARTLLLGLQRARVVFHSTLAVRDEILAHKLLPAARLVHAPYGVAAEFQPEPREEDAELAGHPPFVLHVGSLIPRKNPEFLLRLLIELCHVRPELEVFQVGGTWNADQRAALERAGVLARVHQFPKLGRRELAPYYRAAAAVVLPSLAEGFGLPVIEALACGAPVVVSDIPVLVQVGGEGVLASSPQDLGAFREAVLALIDGRGPRREARLRAAAPYTWAAHARTIVQTYAEFERAG
jgi:glycosyltransferase involved in cell wall biosynthesis